MNIDIAMPSDRNSMVTIMFKLMDTQLKFATFEQICAHSCIIYDSAYPFHFEKLRNNEIMKHFESSKVRS